MKVFLIIFGLVVQPKFVHARIETLSMQKRNNNTKVSAENDFLENFMKPKNLEEVYGTEFLKSVPIYDPDKQTYKKYLKNMERNINFILHTSNRSGNYSSGVQIFADNPFALEKSGFLKNATTKIICHGFMSDYLRGPGKYLLPAYFEKSKKDGIPINIILINWAKMAGIHKTEPPSNAKKWSDIFYFPPASNTEFVGNETARVIQFLVEHGQVNLNDIHLIGHSLGAHVMGNTGHILQRTLQSKVARITGKMEESLDPAGPCFETFSKFCINGIFRRVNKSDAMFVDVIHTHTRCLGMKTPVGHVDFYPNGGSHQPECHWKTFGLCSHRKAIVLLAQSVVSTTLDFLAQKCSNWDTFIQGHCQDAEKAMMGEYCSTDANGMFFLSTLNHTRLALSQKGKIPNTVPRKPRRTQDFL